MEKKIDYFYNLILRRKAGTFLILLLFILICSYFVVILKYLHDEGIFNYDASKLLLEDFFLILFTIKYKPLILLLHIPPSFFNIYIYLFYDILLSSLAIFFLCLAAKEWKIENYNIAGLFVVTSVTYINGAAAGFPNNQGILFTSIVFYLYAKNFRKLCFIFLGFLPFVRYELLLFSIILTFYDLMKNKEVKPVLYGLFFPILYFIGGAVYFNDFLWIVKFFPQLSDKPMEIAGFTIGNWNDLCYYLAKFLLYSSPFLAFFIIHTIINFKKENSNIQLMIILVLVYPLVLVLLHMSGVFGFDRSQRYLTVLIPFASIVVAHAFSKYFFKALFSSLLGVFLFAYQWWKIDIFIIVPFLIFLGILIFYPFVKNKKILEILLILCVLSQSLVFSFNDEEYENLKVTNFFNKINKNQIFREKTVYIDSVIARFCTNSVNRKIFTIANESMIWEIKKFFPHQKYNDYVRLHKNQNLLLEFNSDNIHKESLYVFDDTMRSKKMFNLVLQSHPKVEKIGDFFVLYWLPITLKK